MDTNRTRWIGHLDRVSASQYLIGAENRETGEIRMAETITGQMRAARAAAAMAEALNVSAVSDEFAPGDVDYCVAPDPCDCYRCQPDPGSQS